MRRLGAPVSRGSDERQRNSMASGDPGTAADLAWRAGEAKQGRGAGVVPRGKQREVRASMAALLRQHNHGLKKNGAMAADSV